MGMLVSTSMAAPGFLGLNSQESGVTLESGYATKAYNCIIDKFGRLGSRRGWVLSTTDKATLPTDSAIESIFQFKDTVGGLSYLSSGALKLFSGLETLTQVILKVADQTTTSSVVFTGNDWQWCSLPLGSGQTAVNNAFLVQDNHEMLVYRRTSDTGTYIAQKIGHYGVVPTGVTIFNPSCALSAFGRVWVGGLSVNKTMIHYSRLLNGADFAGVGSGLLDISSVVNDDIVAIANHNKFLVIFCKNNIVIYSGASDPTKMELADVITGVGCISRDSVQATGTDLIFLSLSGVRSLARTLQDKSMPMRELSMNVRDELVSYLNGELPSTIKSAYFERDALYLLTLPSLKQIMCFDMRAELPNKASRVTMWTGVSYKAFCSTSDRNLLLGVVNGIGKYFGYLDNTANYRLEYFTAHTDVGAPTIVKLLKKIALVIIGGGSQDFTLKYAFDYKQAYTSRAFTTNLGGLSTEYNIAEYNIGEFTSGIAINTISVNASGSGKVLQIGVEATIDGVPVSIQKLDLYLVKGRVA